MVDFAKIREQNKQAVEVAALKVKAETVNNAGNPTWLMRVNHLIEYHLAEMDDWQESFIYSVKTWLVRQEDNKPSAKQQQKIEEMEQKFCNQMCHALMKAGVPHATGE